MDADILRIILAVLGALIIAGLYYREQRRRQRHQEEQEQEEGIDDGDRGDIWRKTLDEEGDRGEAPAGESRMGAWSSDDATEALTVQEQAEKASRLPTRTSYPSPDLNLYKPDPELAAISFPAGPMLVVLHVAAREGEDYFDGAAIVLAARIAGLEPGDREIFHCNLGDEHHTETLFSMANMVKPGTFPFGAMADFTTPGLTLFAQLDGQPGDPGRLEELLGTAHSLARDLGGEVRDDRRQPLTPEGEETLRQRVMAFVTQRMAEES
jgi:cell division protein ZipA